MQGVAGYEMEMIMGSAISNLSICLPMTPQVRTHSDCFRAEEHSLAIARGYGAKPSK